MYLIAGAVSTLILMQGNSAPDCFLAGANAEAEVAITSKLSMALQRCVGLQCTLTGRLRDCGTSSAATSTGPRVTRYSPLSGACHGLGRIWGAQGAKGEGF